MSLSFLLRSFAAAALLAGGALSNAAAATAAAGEPSLTFGLVADTHSGWARWEKAVAFWKQNGATAAVVVGDIIGNPKSATEYAPAGSRALAAARAGGLTLVTAMGNHDIQSYKDYDRYTALTGNAPNKHYVVNGYHFISVAPGANGATLDPATGRPSAMARTNYRYVRAWLRAELEKAVAADPKRPVFVLVHVPVRGTIYVSNEWGNAELGDYAYGAEPCDGKSVFDDFPQAVVFSGHTHIPNNTPRSIWQRRGGFTAVNAPPFAYLEMENGVEGGTVPDDRSRAGQAALVNVRGGTVTVRNYDLDAGWISQTWTFDAGNPADRPYTNARFAASLPPVWRAGSAITVGAVTHNTARVDFPQARPVTGGPAGDIVHSYRYVVRELAPNGLPVPGVAARDFKRWSAFYLTPQPATSGYAIPALRPDTRYELRVFPINAYGKQGAEPLTATFATGAFHRHCDTHAEAAVRAERAARRR